MSTLATTPRPPAASAWAATLTLGWRAMLKIKHVPFQLFDVTAFPLMMTLMFTYLFCGALLGDVFRYSLAATMVISLGLIMGFRPAAGFVGVVLAIALVIVFAMSLSWMWIIVGM